MSDYYIVFKDKKDKLHMYEYPSKDDLYEGLEKFKHYRFAMSFRSFGRDKEDKIAMIIKGEIIKPKAVEFTVTKWEID